MSPNENFDVHIIMGSLSDEAVGKKAADKLQSLDIPYKVSVASAHRTPDFLEDIVSHSPAKVFIAIAGLAAALPGAIASHTGRPVIGVPVSGKVNMDSILSIVQMPPGIPVGCVGLDRGDNAAILAAQMLGVADPKVAEAVNEMRVKMASKVRADCSSVEL